MTWPLSCMEEWACRVARMQFLQCASYPCQCMQYTHLGVCQQCLAEWLKAGLVAEKALV